MFYLVEMFRTSSLGDSNSSNPKRTAQSRRGEKPGNTEVLQQRTGSLNIKRLLLIKENQTSQVKEFSAFLYMGRCKSLGSLKLFLWYASQLSGASILCFSHPELPWGSPKGVAAVWWLLDGRYSFLPEFPQGSPSVVAHLLMTVTSFVYWYSREYSISHDQVSIVTVETPKRISKQELGTRNF